MLVFLILQDFVSVFNLHPYVDIAPVTYVQCVSCLRPKCEFNRAVILARAVCRFLIFSHVIQFLPCACNKDSSDVQVPFEFLITGFHRMKYCH